jgi:hypothetical protein
MLEKVERNHFPIHTRVRVYEKICKFPLNSRRTRFQQYPSLAINYFVARFVKIIAEQFLKHNL